MELETANVRFDLLGDPIELEEFRPRKGEQVAFDPKARERHARLGIQMRDLMYAALVRRLQRGEYERAEELLADYAPYLTPRLVAMAVSGVEGAEGGRLVLAWGE
jgi:hypothetical protein